MKKDQMAALNKVYRNCLKPNWDELDGKETMQGHAVKRPTYIKEYASDHIVSLQKDTQYLEKHSMSETMYLRKSIRHYEDKALSFEELSYLVLHTSSVHKIATNWSMGVIPTPGATKSLETYLYIDNVTGVQKGLYHFNSRDSKLYLIEENVDKLLVDKALRNQLRGAQVVFFWSATPIRTEYKYAFTAHKMIAMEAGHACQNLYLSTTCLDLGMVAIGAYHQDAADELLSLDGDAEFVIYIATVGHPKLK